MAMFFPYGVQCGCGEAITASLADGVNAGRNPEYRDQILRGEFHRVACPKCGRVAIVEKSFFYTDLTRGSLYLVKPRQDRHLWREVSAQLESSLDKLPEELAPADKRRPRVVFGMAELREKLVSEDLRLDDQGIELLKVAVVHQHPFLIQRPRLRLMLDQAKEDTIEFVASYDLAADNFRISVPLKAAKDMVKPDKAQAWVSAAGHKRPAGETKGDYWVNMWRWSPQPSALGDLKAFAAEVRAGRKLDYGSERFKAMIKRLPRGSVLPGWAKTDLQTLFDEARRIKNEPLQDALFEVRFGKDLDDDWALNEQPDDIDTLWQLMKTLPPSNVEGNAAIDAINLAPGEGGGWYEPNTYDIYIGSRLVSDRENFEDVVRHEIGHGVHEGRKKLVDGWLEQKFGWKMLPGTAAGVNNWVAAMGGWEQWGVTKAQRAEVAGYLLTLLGPGAKWGPGPTPNVPPGHPWWRADFGPRLAGERSVSHWYRNNANWYRRGGKAFSLNYYYRSLMVIDEAALALVGQMPSNYAAMSPFEFFAELYALYYDLDDPMWGAIPADVQQWLATNIGGPYSPPPAMPGPPEEDPWEGVKRP